MTKYSMRRTGDKWLKTIYDMQPDTKVVATGSASPVLVKGSRESGAGRWSAIQVPTLSFYEYCELLDIDRPDLPDDLKITPLVYKTQQERTRIMLQLSKVQNHFNRYLQVGGFPELALGRQRHSGPAGHAGRCGGQSTQAGSALPLQNPQRNRAGAYLPVSLQCFF